MGAPLYVTLDSYDQKHKVKPHIIYVHKLLIDVNTHGCGTIDSKETTLPLYGH